MMTDYELCAAYAEGNVSPEEREAARHYLAENPDMMESVLFAMGACEESVVDDVENGAWNHPPRRNERYMENLEIMLDEIESVLPSQLQPTILPMTAMAAGDTVDNQCAIKCEGIALRHFGLEVADEELQKQSADNGWLQPEGTALHNIGRLSGMRGLSVSHRYHCSCFDVDEALSEGYMVLAVVDGNELTGDDASEQKKDDQVGLTPNHVVVVRSLATDSITITDPATQRPYDTYPLSQFLDAWNDSTCSLIIIGNNTEYIPHPILLDDVEVEAELLELREAIAENAHEVWAENRRNEGWTYGSVRDDNKKLHPDLLPYNRLPDAEKEYDRLMAMNTIKLLKKLGWELKKSNNTLNKKKNMKTTATTPTAKKERTYRCNDCGAEIHKHDVFCPKCGKKLDHYDFDE